MDGARCHCQFVIDSPPPKKAKKHKHTAKEGDPTPPVKVGLVLVSERLTTNSLPLVKCWTFAREHLSTSLNDGKNFHHHQLFFNLKVVFVRPLGQGEYVLWHLVTGLILPERLSVRY